MSQVTYPCPHCMCLFCTEADLKFHLGAFPATKEAHQTNFQNLHSKLEHGNLGDGDENPRTGWRPSKWKAGDEWCFASDEPRIASACRSEGRVAMGGFSITLDPTGKYLRKIRTSTF